MVALAVAAPGTPDDGWTPWILVTVLAHSSRLGYRHMLFKTNRRRNDPLAQARSDAATDRLYKDEDKRDG
jgi:hypothetical protein